MFVTKSFTWTNENGEKIEVTLGTDGENVDVNGNQLTNVLDDIDTTIAKNANLCHTTADKLDTYVTKLENRTDALTNIMVQNHNDSWETISKLISSGFAPTVFNIGEQLVTPWTYNGTTYDVPQNICHFYDNEEFSDDNGETVTPSKGMVLQWHYAAPTNLSFDEREALYVVPEGGIAAGIYYFTVTGLHYGWASKNNNKKIFMFTLTDDLTEGQMLMLSAEYNTADWVGTYVRVYDSPYDTNFNTGYGENGNMELSEWDGESGEPLSGDSSSNNTDGKCGLNHIQRAVVGYNRWSQSAIRQWLNSASPARNTDDTENYPGWWKPQNRFDRIPSQAFTYPGFLAGYEDDFIAAMKPVKVVTACNTATDGGVTDITYDKVFLPSLTNMNIAPQAVEGETWDYYKELFAANPVEGRTNWGTGGTYEVLKTYLINAKTTAIMVRLRSVLRGNACLTWFISSSGLINGNTVSSVYSTRPACVIG